MLDPTPRAPLDPESVRLARRARYQIRDRATPNDSEPTQIAKALRSETAFAGQPAPGEGLARVTVTLPKSLARRVNGYRDDFRMSVSSIVEHAVRAYLEGGYGDDLLEDLRARGASRRRTKRKPARL